MSRQGLLRTTASILVAIGSGATVARGGAATQPAAAPAPQVDDKRQMRAQFSAQAGRLPAVSVKSIAEVLRFSVTADMLSVQVLLKESPFLVRVNLPNTDIITTLQTLPAIRRPAGAVGGAAGAGGAAGGAGGGVMRSMGFMMSSRDFSQAGSMTVFTTVSSTIGRLELSRDFESDKVLGSTQLIQDAPAMFGQQVRNLEPVRLYISRTNQITQVDEVKMTLSAPTFTALVRAHPAEVEKYLRPVFHDLGQEAAVFAPNPMAVWQVLADDWTPDEKLTQTVREAVAKFDADDFRERQSAGHTLHELGEPAALALMHIDRSKFSPAVNSGVDTFMAPYLPLTPPMAKKMGTDRGFLLDSQYCTDVILRKLAAARLAKVTGEPLGFDPAAEDDKRLPQVEQIRELFPSTLPQSSTLPQ
jgi:hypothetical protein